MAHFLNNFTSKEDIEREYECTLPEGADILLAWYGDGSYSGSSYVLYRLDSKLYENWGSHCSCYGLEGQWEPQETSIAALKTHTFSDWYDGEKEAYEGLQKVILQLEVEEQV